MAKKIEKKRRVSKVTAKKVNKKARKASKPSVVTAVKLYPFESKRDIAVRISNDDQAAVAALVQLHSLDAGMCSQKKAIATLAGRVVEAGDAAANDTKLVEECRAMALHYTRRLAKESREQKLRENPELSELAELYSAAWFDSRAEDDLLGKSSP